MKSIMTQVVGPGEINTLVIVGGNDGGVVNPQLISTTIISIIVICLSIT